MKLSRKTNGKVANVDHFLHFTQAFRDWLAAFNSYESGQVLLACPQAHSKQADEFSSARGGDTAPFQEGKMCGLDR